MRQTEDLLIRNVLESTAGFINCVSGVNADNPTEITRADIDFVIRTLRGNSAYSFVSGISGENRFGTAPVRDAYFAMGHTDLIGQLENCNGFIQKWNYPNQQSTLESEHGAVANLRFLLSPVGSTTPSASLLGATVYNVFCTGREAYATINMDSYSNQFIYLPPQFSGPLMLNSSAGYKFAAANTILNDQWIFNLRCTLA